jgi:diphthamide synthase (EF-2-diphthine--ammonia ligase)
MSSKLRELLQRQADAAGLPLRTIDLPDPCTNEQCDTIMGRFVRESVAEGVECIAFGDLFLEDIRSYREGQLRGTGIQPIFPLWGSPTGELVEQMLSAGVGAYVSCVDLRKLPPSLAGKKWSKELIAELRTIATHVEKTGRYTPWSWADPCFGSRSPSVSGRSSKGTGLPTRISPRSYESKRGLTHPLRQE